MPAELHGTTGITIPWKASAATLQVANMSLRRHMLLWHVDRGRPLANLGQDLSHPIEEVVDNDKSTASGPTSSLQSIQVPPVPNVIVDNDGRRRQLEKHNSPDMTKRRDDKATRLKDRQAHDAFNSKTPS
jgi:hypothetical protein